MMNDSIPNPCVSVLMPCFNVADTLDEAMQSLLEQSLEQFEVVAVDDGSTDRTGELLRGWHDRDGRVRVLSIEHAGIIEALNHGWRICGGDFIARMDADDRAHPERLEKQVAYLQDHPDVAVAGCLVDGFPVDQVHEGFKHYIAWLNSLVSSEAIARAIYIESPLAHPSVMMCREWLERMDGYQERGWPEDYDLWLRMHLAGARFAKVEQVLLEWREHPGRLTRTDSRYSVENFLRAKAHYLAQGPLQGRDALILWGAGRMGRRLSKHLLRAGAPLRVFVDIDPKKIGRRRFDRPIIPPHALLDWWSRYDHPIVLAAVGSRGARGLIRAQLNEMGLEEGSDWWAVA